MTDDKIALRTLLEKGSGMTFLREMIGFAAERLMQLETETLCGAVPGERSADRLNQRDRCQRSHALDMLQLQLLLPIARGLPDITVDEPQLRNSGP